MKRKKRIVLGLEREKKRGKEGVEMGNEKERKGESVVSSWSADRDLQSSCQLTS